MANVRVKGAVGGVEGIGGAYRQRNRATLEAMICGDNCRYRALKLKSSEATHYLVVTDLALSNRKDRR